MQPVITFLRNNKMLVALALIALVAVFSAVWNWYHPQVKTVTATQYHTVTQEKVVEKIKRVTVPGPERIVTIEKPVIVEKLGLPPAVADNPSKVITGNADVPPSDNGTSVIAVLDVDTGETEMIAKEKPLSLFGFPSNIEAGVRYGITTDSIQGGDIFARWQFLRLGKVFIGAYGEISTKPEAKAMVEAVFRF